MERTPAPEINLISVPTKQQASKLVRYLNGRTYLNLRVTTDLRLGQWDVLVTTSHKASKNELTAVLLLEMASILAGTASPR